MDIVPRLAQWAENDMRAEGVALDAKYEIERLREALKTIARFSEDWGAFAEAALQQKKSESP